MRNMVTSGLTVHDLANRKNYICASECPAIMGTSLYANAADVYEWKIRELASHKASKAQKWGQRVEGILLLHTEDALREFLNEPGLKITRRGIRRVHANGVMACTLDAKIVDRDEAIEAKTHALIHGGIDLSQWGTDAWTDAVPPYVRDQVLFQQGCCPELIRTWIPLWVGGRDPIIYCLERANYLARIALIEETMCNFNDNHLVAGVAPDMAPHLDTMKRDITPRQAVTAAVLEDAPVVRSKEITAQMKILKDEKDSIDAGLRRDMSGFTEGLPTSGH
ncbi:MAG: YqaJ viral recombinase family protein, partial [Phycisphaerae bacterium]